MSVTSDQICTTRRFTASLLWLTIATGGLLYCSRLIYVALTEPYGGATALTCAGGTAIAAVLTLQLQLARHATLSQALAVNLASWIIFALLFASDGLLLHRGLAKDVALSPTAIVAHVAVLLALAIRPAALSTGAFLLVSKPKRG